MKPDHKYLIDGSFSADSRVWIYQASRSFTIAETLEIEEMINQFAENWKSHGAQVKGAGYLFYGQFIVLMADEAATGISGCSTDSSVRMIKEIEERNHVNMFDRTTLAFLVNEKVQLLPIDQVQYAVDSGFIIGETLYFNNLAQTRLELENGWIIPLKDSWLSKRISLSQSLS